MAYLDKQFIRELGFGILRELAGLLDMIGPRDWKALISAMPNNPYKPEQVSAFERAVLRLDGSPSMDLLNDLAVKCKTVKQLIVWLKRIENNQALDILGYRELVQIIEQPKSQPARVGTCVTWRCKATGYPAPEYKWFKNGRELPDKVEEELTLYYVTLEDSGRYMCIVSNRFNVVESNTVDLQVLPSPDLPVIASQLDHSDPVLQDSHLTLDCGGVGRPAQSFQHYYNDTPIQDETNNVLKRSSAPSGDQGVYICRVYRTPGETSLNSTQVIIDRLAEDSPAVSQEGSLSDSGSTDSERVENKVALLIGNEDYHDPELGKLFHPINDVCDLTGRLVSMDFKVVSLVNLTLQEMRQALVEFCILLVEDTYAVFYFAGHGFECGGRSYLMPVDATDSYLPNENMASAEILCSMQDTKAKLNVVLMDCCRTEPDHAVHNSLLLGGDLQDITEPNVVVAFGCCSNSSVFECEQEKNGFFAKHLLKNITDEHKNKSIEEVLLQVSRGIQEENLEHPVTLQRQVVNRITTSVKPMSLWTPVDSSSMNPSAIKATAMWQSAHEIPSEPVTVFEDRRAKIQLIFNAEVSNVLIVNARVLGKDDLDLSVTFDMSDVVSGCSIERGEMKDKKCRPSEATVKVKDLQRLTDPLVFKLKYTYTLNSERKQKTVCYTMAEKPLYAKLVTEW